MVADVTETCNIIPSLDFKTWTIKSLKLLLFWAVLNNNLKNVIIIMDHFTVYSNVQKLRIQANFEMVKLGLR